MFLPVTDKVLKFDCSLKFLYVRNATFVPATFA